MPIQGPNLRGPGAGPGCSSRSKAHLFTVNKGLCTHRQTGRRPRSSSCTKANHTEHTEACVLAVSPSQPR